MTYELTIHTASWTAAHRHSVTVGPGNEGYMPVRTSVGLPRFWPEARGFPVAKLLTPYGLRKFKGDEFRDAYLARLDKAGLDAIRAELADIALAYGSKPLALLCFERQQSDCHRGMFAAFWQHHTGEALTEIEPVLSNVGQATDLAMDKISAGGEMPENLMISGGNQRAATSGRLRLDAPAQLQLAPVLGAERNQ